VIRDLSPRYVGALRNATPIPDIDVKVWAVIGGTPDAKLHSSYNVTSLTDNAVGDFTLTFQQAFVNASNYAVLGMFGNVTASLSRGNIYVRQATLPTSTSCRTINIDAGGAAFDADPTMIFCVGWW